jgi:hypothetical protein
MMNCCGTRLSETLIKLWHSGGKKGEETKKMLAQGNDKYYHYPQLQSGLTKANI